MENSIDLGKNLLSKHIIDSIQTANKDITHKNFIAGVKNGTINFKILFTRPNKLIYGLRKTISDIFVLLYMAAPVIIVPVFAYYADNWWLLLGITFSYTFSYFATFTNSAHRDKWKSTLILFYLSLCVIYWITTEFNFYSYITFFFFCSLWGTLLLLIAKKAQYVLTAQLLIKDIKLFNLAIEENLIMIIPKGEENRSMNEEQITIFYNTKNKKLTTVSKSNSQDPLHEPGNIGLTNQ